MLVIEFLGVLIQHYPSQGFQQLNLSPYPVTCSPALANLRRHTQPPSPKDQLPKVQPARLSTTQHQETHITNVTSDKVLRHCLPIVGVNSHVSTAEQQGRSMGTCCWGQGVRFYSRA
jgi:hypothetical protein